MFLLAQIRKIPKEKNTNQGQLKDNKEINGVKRTSGMKDRL
jgi:hypothetical protein